MRKLGRLNEPANRRREMLSTTRTGFLAVAAMLSFGGPVIAQSPKLAVPQVSTASKTGIELSFKRDPRLVDPFRGIGPWVTGSNYTGATAQDTVEVRAEALSASGRPAKISPEWSASDTEMVTVSPSQGDDVKITVHKAGESRLKIT